MTACDIELPTLYPHQAEQKDRVRAALAKHRRVILCAPTGVGKTRLSKWILGAAMNRESGENASGQYLWTVHRRGLVDNAVGSFEEAPDLPHGVIMSGAETAYRRQVQVASVDSLLSWFIENDNYHPDITFDLVVMDEAHSHHAKLARFLKYHDARREELGLYPAYVIGLTATPQAKGLADVYGEIVPGPPTQWLIDNRYLSPFRYFRATEGKLGLLVKRGDRFTDDSQDKAMGGLSGSLVRDYQQYASDRPTIGFFPRRSHAKAAMQELLAAGVRAAYVDGETPDDERRKLFRDLNTGYLDYLCNVMVVERGTDIPAVSCIQACVAIASIVRWRQIIGRGSRVHPGKTDTLVLDHGGNLKRGLGFFEDDPPWSLDVTVRDPGEAGVRPAIECPQCHAIYRGGLCRACGYEPTPKERRGQGLEFDGRELVEVKQKEKKASVKTAEELMVASLYRAGKSHRTWRQAVGIFKRACKKQGTNYQVPKTVQVGSHRYQMLRYGSLDAGAWVSELYPFTVGSHGGAYMVVVASESTENVY